MVERPSVTGYLCALTMVVHHLSYADTERFPRAVLDHLAHDPFARRFLEHPPDEEGLRTAAAAREFPDQARAVLCATLRAQYAAHSPHPAVQANLERLKDLRTLTVTTGHQLCLFSGPLYVPYKLLNAIRLARQAETLLDRPVVPVFWMASEDHDAAEIDHAVVNGRRVSWPHTGGGAVGRLELTGIGKVVDEVLQALGPATPDPELVTLLCNSYRDGRTLAEATRIFVNGLFGRYGLLILDGDDPALKRRFIPVMEEELLNQVTQRSVEYADRIITERYTAQAHVREFNLFHLRPGHRSRIVRDGEYYQVLDGGPRWTLDELLMEVNVRPQDFSPNVLLRPVYQETVLPNIAYIGGGGELAYWMQTTWLFRALRVPMPVIFLRTSAATISAKHLEQWRSTGLDLPALFQPLDTVMGRAAHRSSGGRTELNAEREQLLELYRRIERHVLEVDGGLNGAVEAARVRAMHGLTRLEKSMLRAVKRDQAVLMDRLRNIHDALFPQGQLQERRDNILLFLATHGTGYLDTLLNVLDPLERRFVLMGTA